MPNKNICSAYSLKLLNVKKTRLYVLGQAQAFWDVRIPDDKIEEENEKFRIVLEEPVNAIMGNNERVTVRIINARKGTHKYITTCIWI